MARERAYMFYEIEVAMATYVTPCVQSFLVSPNKLGLEIVKDHITLSN
ncbi:hypothetical protein F383_32090 [Gossypium arboreum]|uniref:Uncharacterized protein n=1 Tax=Gossypium arboreum TaxID=29729 RepID=A0A0B0PK71_GOSAR|nr:hypothetical protein F383_32090 [Gossypium arboreum]